MTGLLKSGSALLRDRVRPLDALRAVAPADAERMRLEARVEALTAELALRDEAIVTLTGEVEAAFRKGEAEGREASLAEIEVDRAEAIAAIQDGAEQALIRFTGEIKAMERLAALLAQTCLDRMLLGSKDRARIVRDLIRGQVEALQAEFLVRVQVSAEDFDSVEEIGAALADPRCEILASSALGAGDCTITLQLGALDIGIDQQWGALRAALEAMIAADAGTEAEAAG